MKAIVVSTLLLASAIAAPVNEASAQNVLGGALLGGAVGGVLGGAVTGGRGSGIAIGAILGAGAGAAIASEGQRRRNGYYAYQRGCWVQRRDGAWLRVSDRYCY
jgi:outer membrane lipoprotein SlyB